jgi:drug/metabolite transporter (DMT)-like permease
MKDANTKDLSLLLLLSIIWGSAFFNIKIATYSYEPFTLALVRVIFASIPLFLLCKFKKIKIEAFGKNWNRYALIGLSLTWSSLSHLGVLSSRFPHGSCLSENCGTSLAKSFAGLYFLSRVTSPTCAA